MVEKSKDADSQYPANDIEIVPLSPIYKKIVDSFSCEIKDLEGFLKEDALNQQEASVNTTYLWVSKEKGILLGYTTFCTDTIHLEGEKKKEMVDAGIPYKSLPALKICRMAVHTEYTRHGIGTLMIAAAVDLALKLNEAVGCRFLTLEAKNLQNSKEGDKPIHFYRKNEFTLLKERKPNPSYIPMYKD